MIVHPNMMAGKMFKCSENERSYTIKSLLEGEGTQLVGPNILMVGEK
jgi:hypothetical protein